MSNERMDYESRRALVFQAANEMADAGQVPGLEAVKQKVGGSYTTITRALREWRKERDQQQAEVDAPPEAVSELAQRLAGDLWKQELAEAKSATTPTSLQEEIQSLRAQLSTLTEQNAKILAKD